MRMRRSFEDHQHYVVKKIQLKFNTASNCHILAHKRKVNCELFLKAKNSSISYCFIHNSLFFE